MSVLISVPIAMAISQYSNLNHACVKIHMDTLKLGSHFWICVFDEKFVIVHPAGTTLFLTDL